MPPTAYTTAEIEADPALPIIRITRDFAATPAQLHRAHTDPDEVALETLRFEDLGDGRTRLHAQSLVDSFEGRDAWLRSGMSTGINEGYDKLEELVTNGVP